MTPVRSGRSPFEIYLLAACVLTGIGGIINPRPSAGAVQQLLPMWELYAWYGGLAGGGLIALAGVVMAGVSSLLVERVGLFVLSGWSTAWAMLLGASFGARATLAALFVGAFGAACLTRAVLIHADLRRLMAAADLLRSDREGGN